MAGTENTVETAQPQQLTVGFTREQIQLIPFIKSILTDKMSSITAFPDEPFTDINGETMEGRYAVRGDQDQVVNLISICFNIKESSKPTDDFDELTKLAQAVARGYYSGYSSGRVAAQA